MYATVPPGMDGTRAWAWLGASRLRFALLVSVALLLPYNLRFWRESLDAVGGPTLHGMLFLIALGAMLVTLHAMLLAVLPGRRTAPIAAAALFILASIVAYFSNGYGVYFDSDMLRNVFETDAAETRDLLNGRLLAYVVLGGLIPALVTAPVVLRRETWPRRLGAGIVTIVGGFVLMSVLALAFSATLASYLREHKSVRYLITPANAIYGTVRYVVDTREATRPFKYVEGTVERAVPMRHDKPLLVFLAIGETARAANFTLDGYARPTNPRLAARQDLLFFRDVRSCGTSTSISVPCMFSHQGRAAFELDIARYRSNLLDAVSRGGVEVEWRDNNSGCKHVCDRFRRVDPCAREHCFDEEMLAGLRAEFLEAPRDRLVVFHQAGSHGPAYFERYPAAFEVFTPACRSRNLGKCSRESIVNAYDNSIRYTDHVLAEQIALLESLEKEFDSVLLYVSDHGESLGENGIFLHAAPYFIAPDEQTHVPMLMWMSSGYRARFGLERSCLRARTIQPASHDNVYHTILGALGLRSSAYRATRDLLAPCRSRGVT